MMVWFITICAVAVLGLAAVVGSGRFGEMPSAVVDTPPAAPVTALSSQAIREAKFDVVIRGYSMEQVDELLNRIAEKIPEGWLESADLVPGSQDDHQDDDYEPVREPVKAVAEASE